MRIRMFSQIANIIVYCLVILFGIIVAITLSVKLTWQTFVNGMVYYWCQTLAPMRDIFKSQPVYTIRYYGHELKYNAQQILQDKYIQWCADGLDGLYSCRHHRGRGVRYYLLCHHTDSGPSG